MSKTIVSQGIITNVRRSAHELYIEFDSMAAIESECICKCIHCGYYSPREDQYGEYVTKENFTIYDICQDCVDELNLHGNILASSTDDIEDYFDDEDDDEDDGEE